MRTTRTGPAPDFLGADLTDGTVARPRAVDVCGLRRARSGLVASFWDWRWDGGVGDVASVAEELRATRCALLDGPQALAAPGRAMRACERLVAAAGKTPDAREKLVLGRPYAGFVRCSLDLFAALDAAGVPVSPEGIAGGVGEIYPGHLWRVLSPGVPLARKTTVAGVAQRRAILAAHGVRLPSRVVTHDQLDAALAALAAAAASGAVPGLAAELVGDPLVRRPDGLLQEGPLVVLSRTLLVPDPE